MTGARARRQAAYRRGVEAESRVADLYRSAGFKIVGARVRTSAGEIDLVAEHAGTVVFVEVKRRKTLDGAAEAVSRRQQHRIVRAAMVWIADNADFAGHDMRFDVVLLAPAGQRRHIVDAFQADGVDLT